MNKQTTLMDSLLRKADQQAWESWWNDVYSLPEKNSIPPAEPTDYLMTTKTSKGFTVTNPDTEQIGGRHYKKLAIQPWDYVIANDLDYFQGSIIKYVTRWKDKGWTEDLHKAKHFLDKYIVTMEEKYKGLKQRDIEDGNPNPNPNR